MRGVASRQKQESDPARVPAGQRLHFRADGRPLSKRLARRLAGEMRGHKRREARERVGDGCVFKPFAPKRERSHRRFRRREERRKVGQPVISRRIKNPRAGVDETLEEWAREGVNGVSGGERFDDRMRAGTIADGDLVKRLAPPLKTDLAERRFADDDGNAAELDLKGEEGCEARAILRERVGKRQMKILIALRDEVDAVFVAPGTLQAEKCPTIARPRRRGGS